ncbi:4-hydroxybenzoate polyprenyltransferase [Roseivirga pacifica]|uniref:4-hydroxybenzoate polyprenyltransferase n=1 Tax=Roseivirga pacifica TaxID=1267423 RepID=A0A1I0N5L0_9BACT|nr:geranylgeranylglycerol-phosphate geranylgeranyltransferase [Roseivirga pacifica]RKQ50926.1 4-hydroxybenzoate polyprenyltransferase [Roseivirga pacifica]SEV96047.1 4-hydroxybenzoate polyprenyltransferase [Roseivirga pacifica]
MQLSTILRPSFVFSYLKLIRGVNLFLVALTQYLTAIFLIGNRESWLQILTDKGFFLMVSATVMITSAGYLINDYYDVKIDFVNKPKRVVVGKKLGRRWVIAGHTILNLTAIAFGFLLSIEIGLIMFGAAFLLWLYSNQLKRLPFVGNLSVALLTGTTLILVAEYFHDRAYIIACYAILSAFITLIREIIKDMEDMKGDARFGCKTVPIVLGIAKTKWVLYCISLAFIITVFVLIQHISLVLPSILFITLILLNLSIAKADTVKAFGTLSTYCKIIMLLGVLSMIWI